MAATKKAAEARQVTRCAHCGVREKHRKYSRCQPCLREQQRATYAQQKAVIARTHLPPIRRPPEPGSSRAVPGHEERMARYEARAALGLPLFGGDEQGGE